MAVLYRAQPPGRAAHTLHHPPTGSVSPAKMLLAASIGVAFPWYCVQLPQVCVGLNVGFAAASTFFASATKPKAFAVGSLGSNGTAAMALEHGDRSAKPGAMFLTKHR